MLEKMRPPHWVLAGATVGGAMLSIPLQREFYGAPLDVRLIYSGADALHYLLSLDPATARSYLLHELLDLAFMVFYSGFFWSAWPRTPHWIWQARLFGLLAGFFDLVETSGIIALLLNPELEARGAVAGVIATATPIKYVVFYSALSVVIAGWLRLRRAKVQS